MVASWTMNQVWIDLISGLRIRTLISRFINFQDSCEIGVPFYSSQIILMSSDCILNLIYAEYTSSICLWKQWKKAWGTILGYDMVIAILYRWKMISKYLGRRAQRIFFLIRAVRISRSGWNSKSDNAQQELGFIRENVDGKFHVAPCRGLTSP